MFDPNSFGKAFKVMAVATIVLTILGTVVAGLIIWGLIEIIPEIVAYFQK